MKLFLSTGTEHHKDSLKSMNFELSYLSALREDLQYKHTPLPPEKSEQKRSLPCKCKLSSGIGKINGNALDTLQL